MCRLLKGSPSGFYAWEKRPMSPRERSDIALTARIHEIYRRSRETYGSPMIHAELADDHQIRVGRKRVARLMRAAGLHGATLRKVVVKTGSAPHDPEVAGHGSRGFFHLSANQVRRAGAGYITPRCG